MDYAKFGFQTVTSQRLVYSAIVVILKTPIFARCTAAGARVRVDALNNQIHNMTNFINVWNTSDYILTDQNYNSCGISINVYPTTYNSKDFPAIPTLTVLKF